MDKEMLTLWYLDSYRDNVKEALCFNRENTFDFLKLKVNICKNKNEYKHYLNLSNFSRTVLYGSTGSGKTYVLESLLKNILFRSKKYCMYFDLKEYNNEDLFELIAKQLKYKNISKEKIQKIMKDESISFIFDNYHLLTFEQKKRINSNIFNNDDLINFKFIISSNEFIGDIDFDEEFNIKSLSVKKSFKKALMSSCKDQYEAKKIKEHLVKYKLECFLYRPLNLSYLIKIVEWEGNISSIYNLKSERDLYRKYLEALCENKKVIDVSTYIAYYMARNTDWKIEGNDLRNLTAEALRNFSIQDDPDEILKVVKETVMIKCSIGSDVYIFEDENLKMYLIDEYLDKNKIRLENILFDRKFKDYLKWKCSIDPEFTYNNLENLSDEFLKNIFLEIEDKKVDKFYEYIELFFKEKAYSELMSKLNIIFQRFRWEIDVQKLTLKYLRTISKEVNDKDILQRNKLIKFICRNENKKDLYKISKSLWNVDKENCDIIKEIYRRILD